MLTMHNPQRVVWHGKTLELQREYCEQYTYCYGIRLIDSHYWPNSEDLIRIVQFILNGELSMDSIREYVIDDFGYQNEKLIKIVT